MKKRGSGTLAEISAQSFTTVSIHSTHQGWILQTGTWITTVGSAAFKPRKKKAINQDDISNTECLKMLILQKLVKVFNFPMNRTVLEGKLMH